MSIVSHGIAASAIETHSLAIAGTKALEAYIAAGDIGRLDPGQRIALYKAVCDSLGLNPLTQPFEYLTLNGKVQLYAKKSATEQLRQIHGVSVLALEQEMRGDILCMTARVRDRSGREDIATGAVNLKGLAGENLANAYMKCETKSKRRATLSICGLAMLDETEIDSIQGAKPVAVEDFHAPAAKPEPKPMKAMTREERRKDTEDLLSPVPVASAPVVETTAVPVTPDAERVILARSPISVVEGKSGRRVWRIDQEDEARPFAVLDERVASILEAQQAFSCNSLVRVRQRSNGTLEILEVIGDAK
jgi:hypothetical protein